MLGLWLLLAASEAFLMTRVAPGEVLVKRGGRVELLCQTDTDYEYCTWRSPGEQVCEFEWKRAAGNITMQECQFGDKILFHAAYDDRECGITILNVTPEDQGVWSCEMEDYVFGGSRGSGARETGRMIVNVREETTSTPSSTATGPAWRPDFIPTRGTTIPGKDTTSSSSTSTTSSTSSTSISTTSSSDPEPQPTPSPTSPPAAEPSVQDVELETSGSSAGAVGGVLLALVIAAVAVGGVFLYRRRRAQRVPVVGYSESAGMVQGSQAVTIHSSNGSGDSSNYHEYFPPNMTSTLQAPA